MAGFQRPVHLPAREPGAGVGGANVDPLLLPQKDSSLQFPSYLFPPTPHVRCSGCKERTTAGRRPPAFFVGLASQSFLNLT